MRPFGIAALFGSALVTLPAHALSISPTSDATGLANTLVLNLPGLQVTGAAR